MSTLNDQQVDNEQTVTAEPVSAENPVGDKQETEGTQPVAESAEKTVDKTEETEEQKLERSKRNREGYERRLQRERAELKAERDALRRQIDDITKPSAAQNSPDAKPARDQYADDESYIEALADYKVTQKLNEHEKKKEFTTIGDDVKSTVDKAREKYGEEFSEAFESVKDINIPIPVLKAITRYKDVAPEIVREIVMNRPDIIDLPEAEFIGEVVAIRSQLMQSRPKHEVKRTSSAPAPIRPPSVSGGALKKSLSDLDGDDYKKARGYL